MVKLANPNLSWLKELVRDTISCERKFCESYIFEEIQILSNRFGRDMPKKRNKEWKGPGKEGRQIDDFSKRSGALFRPGGEEMLHYF